MKKIIILLIIPIIIYLLLLINQLMFKPTYDESLTYDYLVIPGAIMKEDGTPDLMLRQRIDAAEAILANNPEITIVASGAQGSDEVISEAKAVEKELIKRGYENKIILEENATSTKENIVYSSNYVNGNVVIVSQQFHLFRIQYLLNKYDLDWDVALADNEYILPLKPFYREPFALIKTIIFD